jgi:hypothetical protein
MLRTLLVLVPALLLPAAAHAQAIRGVVVESEVLTPLPGAIVMFLDSTMAVVSVDTADALGQFLTELPAGRFAVQAEMKGRFSPVSALIPTSGADSVVIEIPSVVRELARLCQSDSIARGMTVLAGLVYDDNTGTPLPSASVTLSWDDQRRDALTDGLGRYRFCGVPANTDVLISVSALGLNASTGVNVPNADLARADIAMELGMGSSRVRIVGTTPLPSASANGVILGRVLDAVTRRPIAGAAAVISITGRERPVIVSDDGLFRLSASSEGDRLLEIEHIAYGIHRETVPVRTGVQTEVEVLISPRPIELAAITVTGEGHLTARARMANTRSHVTAGAALAQAEARGARVAEMLRNFAGVSVREGVFATSAGQQRGYCVMSNRRIMTMDNAGDACFPIPVYVDGLPVGDPIMYLGNLTVAQFESIEYLQPLEAGVRYGMEASAAGVILLSTRGRGDHVSVTRNVR